MAWNTAAAMAPAVRLAAPNLITDVQNKAVGRRATAAVAGHSNACVDITAVVRYSATLYAGKASATCSDAG